MRIFPDQLFLSDSNRLSHIPTVGSFALPENSKSLWPAHSEKGGTDSIASPFFFEGSILCLWLSILRLWVVLFPCIITVVRPSVVMIILVLQTYSSHSRDESSILTKPHFGISYKKPCLSISSCNSCSGRSLRFVSSRWHLYPGASMLTRCQYYRAGYGWWATVGAELRFSVFHLQAHTLCSMRYAETLVSAQAHCQSTFVSHSNTQFAMTGAR